MKVFTSRFVKDLFLIVLMGGSLYILLHNPITHPKLPGNLGTWSIQLMQQPLVFGIAGHNYLVLRDNRNTIVEELHGLATNTEGKWEYVGKDPTDMLKVWEFAGPHFYIAQKSYAGIVLDEGDKDTIVSTWSKASACKDEINSKNIPYPPYGVNIHGDTENSNSVAYTLGLCMGLNVSAEHLGLITPGWGKNLLNK